jgi:hypothetical protein
MKWMILSIGSVDRRWIDATVEVRGRGGCCDMLERSANSFVSIMTILRVSRYGIMISPLAIMTLA